MGKSSIPPPAGQVVLVSKPAAAAEPKIREISQKQYEKLRPKKELSEKQKENLAKLVERNKQRALDRRAVVTDAIPESVPEDQELVVVKQKRKYVRKPKNEVIYPSESELESEQETEQSESEVEVSFPSKPKRPVKPKRAVKKPVPKYKYDTETTSADDCSDDDSSEDDDPKVKKYEAKAQARLKAVQAIDQRMSQIQGNSYASRNLSVF